MSSPGHRHHPLDLQLHVDKQCRAFEAQWTAGKTPPIEEYLVGLSGEQRAILLRELLLIEQHYRQDDQGRKLSWQAICALHPNLAADFSAISDVRLVEEDSVTATFTREHSGLPSLDSQAPTRAPSSQPGSSRGLHIRCPHCSNPVELLDEVSIDSILCQTCGSVFSLVNENEATQQAPILKQVGRFEIIGRVGVGGFGTVWKARDPELQRVVAIKIPRKGQLGAKEIEGFLKEARTVAQLHHPNIVPVYEVGRDADTVFIVSELVRGVSLSDWLSGNSPSFRQIAEILTCVASALSHAHQKGVIHRDLKPSNIMIDEAGQPIVMDFGLAKRDGLEVAMTLDGQVLGTPAYMSPEQASGHSHWTDRRMDIYSFGVVLFRMMTGELPFRGNAQTQIHQRLTQDAPDPRSLNRFIPQDLATICLKCLERDPNGRYSQANQVAEELQRFLRGEPILARPISRIERTIRWAKRKPALAATAILLIVLALVGTTAAVVIEGLRQRQGDLLQEKDRLITRMGQDRETLVQEKEDLQQQLDTWEGKANPWTLWPPQPIESPQQILLKSLLAAVQPRADQWRQSSNQFEQVSGHLAIAAMYDGLAMIDLARSEYQQAYDLLRKLCEEQGSSDRYRLALADCCTQLARLSVGRDRERATEYLAEAEEILQKAGGSSLAFSQAELLNVKLDQAVLPGFEGAAESLSSAEQIRNQFEGIVPSDAGQFYRLICQMTRRTPYLALPDAESTTAGPPVAEEKRDSAQ